MSKGKTTGGQEAEEQMNDGQKAERQGGERQSTFADIVPWTALSWAGRLTGAAIVLSLMGALVWAFSLSGSWYLPVGGAVAGGAIGWKDPPHRSSRADAALTYVLRGAALGLAIVFLYQSGCTAGPQRPKGQERERLVQPPSAEGSQVRHKHQTSTITGRLSL